ncbi:LOW QUALITY PROTEIN: hypothetical protein V2J09_023930 [Rumex salicifolius]
MALLYHAIHKEVYEWFNINFDQFGRTSTNEQTKVCQSIFKRLLHNKWLSENTIQQLYCKNCNKFLADRLVEGTCPTEGCNYDSARGDQCDKCGKLLNPVDLINPKCKACSSFCGTSPQERDTDHLFLELPLLKDRLIDKTSEAGQWSQNAIQTTNAWLKEGLRHRCITRDLKWGVPVPHEKFKDKLDMFLSRHATQQNGRNGGKIQKMLSKFSKSKGVGVFGNDAKDTGIPVGVWRYYLLSNRPEFIHRVLSFIAKRSGQGYGSVIPDVPPSAGSHALTNTLIGEVEKLVRQYIDTLEKVKLRDGLRIAMLVSSEGNWYLQEPQFWKVYKEDQTACAVIMRTAAGLVYILACLFCHLSLLRYLVNETPLSLSDDTINIVRKLWEILPPGHKIGFPEPLLYSLNMDMAKLQSNEELEACQKNYTGSQASSSATDLQNKSQNHLN